MIIKFTYVCLRLSEVGISNGTLAIAITPRLLNNPDMAVPTTYSLFMNQYSSDKTKTLVETAIYRVWKT
ncbi:hypothetical protein [Nostoc sp.]|uniref:hypothetical protein n=1 Tax=Nostoc sp. TaxID=1180 RepID=UPI003FA5F386